MDTPEVKGKCDYCKRTFAKSETVWQSSIGTICAPATHPECGATHVDPYRVPVEEWIPVSADKK